MTTMITLTILECPKCFMAFGITSRLEEIRRQDGESFYCPAGHSQAFGAGENAKLKKELSAALSREQLQKDQRHAAELEVQRELEARIKAEKSKSRLEERVKNGVCPCCKRSFCNLQRHIKTKHPEFTTK